MEGKKPSKTNRTGRGIVKETRKHLCPTCSKPVELYVTAIGWSSRGVCPDGHDNAHADIPFRTPCSPL